MPSMEVQGKSQQALLSAEVKCNLLYPPCCLLTLATEGVGDRPSLRSRGESCGIRSFVSDADLSGENPL